MIVPEGRFGVLRGEDGEAGNQRAWLAGRLGEALLMPMEPRESLAGGVGVGRVLKGVHESALP